MMNIRLPLLLVLVIFSGALRDCETTPAFAPGAIQWTR